MLLPHFPGYAKSPPLDGPPTFDAVQVAIEQTLEARGVRESAIVGWSVGAYRALRMAIESPVRVLGVVSLGATQRQAPNIKFAHGLRKLISGKPDSAIVGYASGASGGGRVPGVAPLAWRECPCCSRVVWVFSCWV